MRISHSSCVCVVIAKLFVRVDIGYNDKVNKDTQASFFLLPFVKGLILWDPYSVAQIFVYFASCTFDWLLINLHTRSTRKVRESTA